ncbi:unnamed protein product, partial [Citrullus colocynthis]
VDPVTDGEQRRWRTTEGEWSSGKDDCVQLGGSGYVRLGEGGCVRLGEDNCARRFSGEACDSRQLEKLQLASGDKLG